MITVRNEKPDKHMLTGFHYWAPQLADNPHLGYLQPPPNA